MGLRSTITSGSPGSPICRVSRRSLVKVDTDLPMEEAALFGCAVLTGVGAVFNTDEVPLGHRWRSSGSAASGCASLLGPLLGSPRSRGYRPRRGQAGVRTELGATDTFSARNPGPDAEEDIRPPREGELNSPLNSPVSTAASDLRSR